MKKSILLALVVLSTFDLYSQIEKGITLVSGEGIYHQSTTAYGVTTSQNSVHGKYLNVGASVGYFFTNRFIVGLGLDFKSENEERGSVMTINKYYQQEVMDIKAKAWLPNVYFGCYYPIIEKLYLNTNMKFSYGKLKGEFSTVISSYEQGVFLPSDPSFGFQNTIVRTHEYNTEVDYSSVEVLPELNYFLTPKFCLSLGLGGLGYSMTDWSSDNSTWIVNFNPSYWTLGVKASL